MCLALLRRQQKWDRREPLLLSRLVWLWDPFRMSHSMNTHCDPDSGADLSRLHYLYVTSESTEHNSSCVVCTLNDLVSWGSLSWWDNWEVMGREATLDRVGDSILFCSLLIPFLCFLAAGMRTVLHHVLTVMMDWCLWNLESQVFPPRSWASWIFYVK